MADALPYRGGQLTPALLWQAGEKPRPVLAEKR
jgi:hypothetical protein